MGWLFGEPEDYPPGTDGWPIIGVLASAGDYLQRTLKQWSLDYYGPIFFVSIGGRRQIVLNTVEAIKEAFVTHSDATYGRPVSYIFNQVNGVSFLDDTEKLLSQKEYGKMAFRSVKENGQYIHKFIHEEWNHFRKHITIFEEKPVDLSAFTYRMSGNILTRILYGKRYDYDQDGDVVMLMKSLYVQLFGRDILVNLAGSGEFKKILAVELIPALRFIPPFSGCVARYKERRQTIIDMVQEVVDRHETEHINERPQHWLDYMVMAKKKKHDERTKYFTNQQLCHCIVDILGGGITNASVTYLWMILCALLHPESKKRMTTEIEQAFGNEKDPTWESRKKLPYTCAFMDEVYRTVCPLSRTVTHDTNTNIKLANFTIPKGEEISGNIWGAHHDPETWPDPMKFDPNRHLDSHGNYTPSDDLIPYGVGPRTCFAAYLARMELFLQLVLLFQNYDVTPAGPLPGIYDGIETITYDPKPFEVILTPRHSARLQCAKKS